jgi:uncharacterized alpha-E superfamily protein
MLSRVADSLYWMARYLERAEHTARIIGVQMNLMLDAGAVSEPERWERILHSLGSPEIEGSQQPPALTRALLYDASCDASIHSSINNARENCRQVRNQISSEMWEQLNRLYHDVRRASTDRTAQPLDFLVSVDEGVHLFHGITDSTLSHNEGWQFVQIGRFLERAMNTAALLDVHFRHTPGEGYLEWVGLLRSCTAFEAYCRLHTADVKPGRLAEFLLLDADFPHSIRFSLDRVYLALRSLPGSDGMGSRATRLAGRLQSSLRYLQIDEILAHGMHDQLDDIRRQCGQVHNAFQESYIDYPIEAALTA